MKKILLILISILLFSVQAYAGHFDAVIMQYNAAGGGGAPLTISLEKSDGAGTGGGVSITPDLGSNPASGNLLIAAVCTNNTSTFSTPATWTHLYSASNAGISYAVYYKTSAGTEQTVLLSWSESGRTAGGWVGEFSGFSTPTLDQSANDETHIGVGGATTSQSSGTTAVLSTSDAWAIAIFGAEIGNNVDGGRAVSNSFTEIGTVQDTSSSRPGVFINSKTLSATSAVETTYSTTDGGDQMVGVVAVFKDGS